MKFLTQERDQQWLDEDSRIFRIFFLKKSSGRIHIDVSGKVRREKDEMWKLWVGLAGESKY